DDETGEEHKRNYAKELEMQLSLLMKEIREQMKRIKELQRKLKGSRKGKNGTRAQTLFANIMTPEDELASLEAEIAPVREEIAALEKMLAPYYSLKKALSEQRKCQNEMVNKLLIALDVKRRQLTSEDCERHIVEIS